LKYPAACGKRAFLNARWSRMMKELLGMELVQ
jgi:hypothetical protein